MNQSIGGWPCLAALLLQAATNAPTPLACAGAQAIPPKECAQERAGTPVGLNPLLQPSGRAPTDPANDYRHLLQTTPLGWPLQTPWCVWVEPAAQDPFSQRWGLAVSRALQEWQSHLPMILVSDPQRAQVRIWRRRPPLGVEANGRPRASHGRATLSLNSRGDGPAPAGGVEPRVEVLISPGQRSEAIQATALHELGHAFGLWGHSDDPADAMAIAPNARPILKLSPRDRATLRWLYAQPTPMRSNP